MLSAASLSTMLLIINIAPNVMLKINGYP